MSQPDSQSPTQLPKPLTGGVYGALEASKEWIAPTDPKVLAKIRKWQDQKIGLLITWGTYSEWGIVESWSLVTTQYPWNKRPEQYRNLDDASYMKLYEGLVHQFNPTQFDADKWAVAAKKAGIKYVLSMTKHHDGFCMWDTKTTNYKITDSSCPFHTDPRADVIKQMSDAIRRHGMSSGLYFSKADWHSPYYWLPELGPGANQGPNFDPTTKPDVWKKFKEFTWNQIDELMANYGPQDILWLDGGSVRAPNAAIDMDGMAAMARKRQPGLIVVDRTVAGPNENIITPEGEIPDHYLPYPWETCMTMGNSWPWHPHDNFKSVGTLVRNLCHIVSRGGNYLIGIGPDAKGEFDPTVYERLEGLGNWLKVNGESIYSTRAVAIPEQPHMVFTTKKNGSVYAILLSQTDGESLPSTVQLPAELIGKAARTRLLGYGDLPISPDGQITIPARFQSKSKGGSAWVFRIK